MSYLDRLPSVDIKSFTGKYFWLKSETAKLMLCRYERLAWFPVLIVCLVALGLGGKNLSNPPPLVPATAASVLSFASTIAGFVLTYAGLASDFTTYMDPDVSRYALRLTHIFPPHLRSTAGGFSYTRMLDSSWHLYVILPNLLSFTDSLRCPGPASMPRCRSCRRRTWYSQLVRRILSFSRQPVLRHSISGWRFREVSHSATEPQRLSQHSAHNVFVRYELPDHHTVLCTHS